MGGIAPLKAHLVKTTYNERSQPSKTWNGGRHFTGSAIYSTRGRFCCLYSDYRELHALPPPFFFMRSWSQQIGTKWLIRHEHIAINLPLK